MIAVVLLSLAITYVVGYVRGVDRGRSEERAMQAYRRIAGVDLRSWL